MSRPRSSLGPARGGEGGRSALRLGRARPASGAGSRARASPYVGADGRAVEGPRHARAHPLARDPAGLDGRLDLPARERPPAGDRARRARAQAVPLPPALARRPRRDEVRPHDRLRRRRCRRSARASRRTWRCRGLPREKVLATVVRLLETTLIRVGNEEYARENGSFGLTTLRDRHVDVEGVELALRLPRQERQASTRSTSTTARLARDRAPLPGPARARSCSSTSTTTARCQTIDSDDVNAYLREIAGEDFTAKDFRTWAGTVLAALALAASSRRSTREAQAKKNVVDAIETRRRAARQHARRLPQVLRPPRGDRRLPRRRDARRPRSSARRQKLPRGARRAAPRGGGGARVPRGAAAPRDEGGLILRLAPLAG